MFDFFVSSKCYEIISVERGKIADSEYVVICERLNNKLYVQSVRKMNILFITITYTHDLEE